MSLQHEPYLQSFRGRFIAALRWPQLDALWDALRGRAALGWYVYAVGEPAPQATVSAGQLERFIREIDELLRREHDEDYCGIVYADDLAAPSFIKIYDPHNLGSVCGSSAQPPLPGWVLSLLPPVDVATAFPPPAARRRWWRRVLGV
jgi:hypothetical protein